jgi:hypothetical protein
MMMGSGDDGRRKGRDVTSRESGRGTDMWDTRGRLSR